MIGLDTNVLARYLTEDDMVQARKAAACIHTAVARGDRCFISAIVLCELSWVLRSAYKVSKPDLLLTLDRLLSTTQFVIGSKDIVRAGLESSSARDARLRRLRDRRTSQDRRLRQTTTLDRRARASRFQLLRTPVPAPASGDAGPIDLHAEPRTPRGAVHWYVDGHLVQDAGQAACDQRRHLRIDHDRGDGPSRRLRCGLDQPVVIVRSPMPRDDAKVAGHDLGYMLDRHEIVEQSEGDAISGTPAEMGRTRLGISIAGGGQHADLPARLVQTDRQYRRATAVVSEQAPGQVGDKPVKVRGAGGGRHQRRHAIRRARPICGEVDNRPLRPLDRKDADGS